MHLPCKTAWEEENGSESNQIHEMHELGNTDVINSIK